MKDFANICKEKSRIIYQCAAVFIGKESAKYTGRTVDVHWVSMMKNSQKSVWSEEKGIPG